MLRGKAVASLQSVVQFAALERLAQATRVCGSRARVLACLLVIGFLAACVDALSEEEKIASLNRSIAFIEPGKTTRSDILLHFGSPTAVFEQERIFTYRMYLHPVQGLRSVPHGAPGPSHGVPALGNIHFIIVFDAAGVVERHEVLMPGEYRDPAQSIKHDPD